MSVNVVREGTTVMVIYSVHCGHLIRSLDTISLVVCKLFKEYTEER